MKRNTRPEVFFNPAEVTQIGGAIERAENETSAEIKLVVLRRCRGSIQRQAAAVFEQYGLDQTRERNAVLILLATAGREFLIYGDQGIHEKVGQGFWDDVKEVMQTHFQQDDFGTGLQAGIERIGEKLKQYFPYLQEDINEIDNGIEYVD